MVGFDPSQLDQVNDVVQRLGFSDKRKRNQALRAGMENPGAFQEQNAGVIQEAQQPTEFMGAGRKLAANQNPDASIASIFNGPLAKHGNEWYTYGDTDYSNYQFGTNGYNLKDTGLGTYDIMDTGGNSIGKSYGSVSDAISKYVERNRQNAIANWTPPSQRNDEWGNPIPWTPTYDEQGNAIPWKSRTDEYGNNIDFDPRVSAPQQFTYDSALGEWEALGQLINGSGNSVGGYFPVGHYGEAYTDSLARNPHNQYADPITGLNTLFGSTPLIDRGTNKLLGYKMDLGPGPDSSPYSNSVTKSSKKEQMNSQIWREFNDPEKWGQLGKILDDTGGYFVGAENADKLPGWTNNDSWNYARAKNTGGLGGLLGKLSPFLKMTPMAPFGFFIDAARGMESGNYGASLASILGSSLSLGASDLAGMAGVDQLPSGGFSGSDLVDISSPSGTLSNIFGSTAPMVTNAALGALSSKNPLMGALGGAGNSLGSTLFGNEGMLQQAANKIIGGAANTGIRSLFNQNQEVRGSEQAGRSGGLNAFLQSNPSTADLQQQSGPTEEELLDLQRRRIQMAQRGV